MISFSRILKLYHPPQWYDIEKLLDVLKHESIMSLILVSFSTAICVSLYVDIVYETSNKERNILM